MKHYNLEFQGYTWDEYFYVIANKSGILVAYKGGLDNEGAVKMNEIIFIDGADEISKIYESDSFKKVRRTVENGEKIFFSYAEMNNEGIEEVTKTLNKYLIPSMDSKESVVKITCKGACALFPKEILF